MNDRERQLIQQYDSAHRAYLEAMDAVRAAVFGRATTDEAAKSRAADAKQQLEQAQRELQQFWSAEQVAQEVSG